MAELDKVGCPPLPPYIKREGIDYSLDKERYQTVYAREPGSVAAPTAGLHFSKKLMKKIRAKGVEILAVTLRVGLGTFAPLTEDNLKTKKLHREHYSVSPEMYEKIIQAKREKRRIIAIGTTTVRVLETIFSRRKKMLSGWTDIFIVPGYKFKVVDGMVTNFHLPKSSLLMLVSAFVGRGKLLKAYREAIKKRYRFFSYGDAMLII